MLIPLRAWGAITERRQIAVWGQPAPGIPHAIFNLPGAPVFHESGHMLFGARVFGPAAPSQTVWVGRPEAWQLGAREGMDAPGAPGAQFGPSFSRSASAAAGQFAFFNTLVGPGVGAANDLGIWSGTVGQLALVAREGDPAAQLVGVTYSTLDVILYLNTPGNVMFRARLAGAGVTPENDVAWFYGAPPALQPVARTGDPAPGTAHAFAQLNVFAPNRIGQYVLRGQLRDAAATEQNGLWVGGPDAPLALVARQGTQAPGVPAGASFGQFQAGARINARGTVVFENNLTGPGISFPNNSGVWLGRPGDLRLVYRSGTAAPGAGGAQFGSVPGELVLNDRDQVVFHNHLTGPGVTSANDDSIWLAGTGDYAIPRLLAREGQVAPESGGALFDNFDDAFPSLNDGGYVAFGAQLRGAGVTSANRIGLWVAHPDGRVEIVARTGEQVEIAPGSFRTVTNIFRGISNWEGGSSAALNNLNELGFMLQFGEATGQSGAYVATVPEPAAVSATVGAFACAIALRPARIRRNRLAQMPQ